MQHKTHSEYSNCCNHEHEHHHENHNHAHDHNHDDNHHHDHSGEFILKNEIFSLGLIGILYLSGLIFEQQLHNTPYSIGEYLIFIPAYLLSGWGVLKTAGRNI